MVDGTDLKTVIFYDDEPSQTPQLARVYLWAGETVMSLVNESNPVSFNQILDALPRDPSAVDEIAKIFTGLGYRVSDEPVPLAVLHAHVVRYMMRHV